MKYIDVLQFVDYPQDVRYILFVYSFLFINIVFIVEIGVLIISLPIEATGRDVNINKDRGRSPRFYLMIDTPIETVKNMLL